MIQWPIVSRHESFLAGALPLFLRCIKPRPVSRGFSHGMPFCRFEAVRRPPATNKAALEFLVWFWYTFRCETESASVRVGLDRWFQEKVCCSHSFSLFRLFGAHYSFWRAYVDHYIWVNGGDRVHFVVWLWRSCVFHFLWTANDICWPHGFDTGIYRGTLPLHRG